METQTVLNPIFNEINPNISKRVKDITGQRFGRLTVLEFEYTLDSAARWLCECDCGALVLVRSNHLQRGRTRSCGCFQKECITGLGRDSATHHDCPRGKSRPPLYNSWANMIQRCTNPRNSSYKWYGARGISICDEWREYSKFREWALNSGWEPGLTIERIDLDKGYEPSNCKWITPQEQHLNMSTNKILTFRGESKPMKTWCEELGMPYYTVRSRLNILHWSVEDALTIEVKHRGTR